MREGAQRAVEEVRKLMVETGLWRREYFASQILRRVAGVRRKMRRRMSAKAYVWGI